jgi:hypothetical protein
MGFLSSVGKAFKNVFKGITSVFEPILKPLGKLMNSKLGKAIMIGLSIFTLGSAMVAGYGMFTQTLSASGSFTQAFVEGGKVFMQTLLGKGPEKIAETMPEAVQVGAEGAMQTTETLGALEGGAGAAIESASAAATPTAGSGALTEATNLSTQAAQSAGQAGGVAGTGGMGGGANLPVPEGVNPALEASTGVAAETTAATTASQAGAPAKGWLEKAKDAASGFMDYTKTDGGAQVVGSLISGVGNYYTEKDRQEFEDRIRRQWGKGGKDKGIQNIREGGARVGNLPSPSAHDIASAGRQTAQGGGNRPYFERSYGAGSPAGG